MTGASSLLTAVTVRLVASSTLDSRGLLVFEMATKSDQESGTIAKKLALFIVLFYLIYYIVRWKGTGRRST